MWTCINWPLQWLPIKFQPHLSCLLHLLLDMLDELSMNFVSHQRKVALTWNKHLSKKECKNNKTAPQHLGIFIQQIRWLWDAVNCHSTVYTPRVVSVSVFPSISNFSCNLYTCENLSISSTGSENYYQWSKHLLKQYNEKIPIF